MERDNIFRDIKEGIIVMTLFNASEGIENAKQARAAKGDGLAAKVDKGKSHDNPVMLALADLKDQVGRLGSKVTALTGDVSELKGRQDATEQWQAECQKRVKNVERITAGGTQRQCPGCEELRVDGPEMFPGMLERAATADEPEYHAWRQLCAVCRQGRQAPANG
jgi:hypothetical protein